MLPRALLGILGFVFLCHANAQETGQPDANASIPPAAQPEPAPVPLKPGDAAAGQTKANVCVACHGMDGNAADPQYPKIAGQHEKYLVRQLQLFKAAERPGPLMQPIAATLSEQDMRDLGAYFATQNTVAGVADESKIPDSDESWVQRGERIYRGGKPQTRTPACMACHGPSGRGIPGPSYPALAGQHAQYTKLKLEYFRQGSTWGQGERINSVMVDVSKGLDDADIQALATYIEGLHRATPAAASAAAH